jgi:putative ABC transport system substrate-binding protein
MAYGIDIGDGYRTSAIYAVEIFKGAKASELPVQAPRSFDLTLNLRAARSLGLAFPTALLALADKVIE